MYQMPTGRKRLAPSGSLILANQPLVALPPGI
jgi:hypothetical protein